jgi:hypothetical protein
MKLTSTSEPMEVINEHVSIVKTLEDVNMKNIIA